MGYYIWYILANELASFAHGTSQQTITSLCYWLVAAEERF